MKTDSKKRSLRLGKFIARVYDVYFPGDHGHYGTDADHVPVIPGNDFLKIEVDVRVEEINPAQQSRSVRFYNRPNPFVKPHSGRQSP